MCWRAKKIFDIFPHRAKKDIKVYKVVFDKNQAPICNYVYSFYEKMMLDAKKQLIDKAVEWFKENMDNYYNIDLIELCTDFHMDEFIKDFKKAMEK